MKKQLWTAVLIAMFVSLLCGYVIGQCSSRDAVEQALEATDSCASDLCVETYSRLLGRDIQAF